MTTEVIAPNEVLLNSVRYPVIGGVRPTLTSVFPQKMVIGDYTKASDINKDAWVISDQRGGILIEEMLEKIHADRCYWSTCNLDFKGHIILPTLATPIEPIHKLDDQANTTAAADADDAATLYTLLNEIKGDYNTHRASTTYHVAADNTNAVTSDNASSEATAVALANEIKADYNAHRSQSGAHYNSDANNEVTTDDATAEASAITLANEIKADYNLHLLSGVSLVADTRRGLALRPVGAGTTTQLSVNTGTNWAAVDEEDNDADTTYVYRLNDSTAQLDTYILNNPNGSGTITGVTVYCRVKALGTSTSARMAVRTHSTNYYGSSETPATNYILYSKAWATNPNTSAAWTWDEVNAMEIGIEMTPTATWDVRCTQVWAVVTYTGASFQRTIFANFNNNLWAARGTYLMKLNSTGNAFTDVKINFATNITALIPFKDKLYVFIDSGDYYWYMTADEVFAQADIPSAVLGIVWDEKLIKVDANGQLSYSAAPDSTTPAWTLGGKLPVDFWGINRLGLYYNLDGDDVIYASTTNGLWVYDNANSKWLQTQYKTPDHPNSGKGLVAWRDGLYISAGLDVVKYVPDVPVQIRSMGLDRDDGLPVEQAGEIVKLIGGYNEFFALVDSAEVSGEGYSSVLAYDAKGWQCKWASTVADKAMHDGIVSSAASIYNLWYDHDDDIYSMPLHRNLRNPLKISTDTHGTAGIHITPWFDADWEVGNKLALTLEVFAGADVSADETILVKYRTDHSATDRDTFGSTVKTISSSGLNTYTFGSSVGTAFKAIQFRFDLARKAADTDETPDILYAILYYKKVLPKKWGWRFTVDCSQPYHGKASSQLLTSLVTAAELGTLMEFKYRATTKYVEVRSVEGKEETGDNKKGQYEVFVTEL